MIKIIIARIDIINKKQYEESERYKEIKITFPKDEEELKKDFEYLELNYHNLTIQDTNIVECIFIDREDEDFAFDLSSAIKKVINNIDEIGETIPFQDIEKFYNIVKNLDTFEKDKLLAIMEGMKKQIHNIKDAIKYAQNIDCFNLTEADDNESLARRLVYEGDIDIEDLMEYADMYKLGKDYAEDKNMIQTEYGYLNQERDLKEFVIPKNKNDIYKEMEDEEFE